MQTRRIKAHITSINRGTLRPLTKFHGVVPESTPNNTCIQTFPPSIQLPHKHPSYPSPHPNTLPYPPSGFSSRTGNFSFPSFNLPSILLSLYSRLRRLTPTTWSTVSGAVTRFQYSNNWRMYDTQARNFCTLLIAV